MTKTEFIRWMELLNKKLEEFNKWIEQKKETWHEKLKKQTKL
jgi:hypothetical protein